jgi:hypothetical protein
MTIPALRHAIQRINTIIRSRLTKLSVAEAVPALQKEWKKVFGKEISKSVASDYLKYMSSKGSMKGGGGQQMADGAPITYTMGQPVGAHEPSVVPYVNQGFGFANMDSITESCGTVDTTPTVPASIGSGGLLMGGSRKNKTRKQKKQEGGFSLGTNAVSYAGNIIASPVNAVHEMFQRPFHPIGAPTANGPYTQASTPGLLQTAQMLSKGYGPLPNGNFASPRPEINTIRSATRTPVIYGAGISKSNITF